MKNFLIRKFVKNYEDIEDLDVRQGYGKLAGVVGIVSNILLCAMKVVIGIISNSIAIVADGINNLADASSSVITLVGFKLASLPEDKDHPYGHARIEYLTGLLVSALIIIVGVSLARTSIDKILHPDVLDYSISTIIVLIIAIAIKIWQAIFNISLGKKINSIALIATGTDSRNDVISTSVVLISVLISRFSQLELDGYIGCLVALFIIWSGISLVKETSSPLLGEAPDPELVRAIEEMSMKYEGVLGIHDLVVHNYGPGRIFASMHVEVDASADILESHDMIDNIERELGEKLRIHLVVHMDPVKTNDPLLNELKHLISDEIKEMDGVLSLHDFRMVEGPTHTNIIFDIVLAINCKLRECDIKNQIDALVKEKDPTYFVVITFDKSYVTNVTEES